MTDADGMLIGGRYRLIEPVGRGGMGRVWRGRDETLHREVAVKEILFPAGLEDEQRELLLQRVMREARVAAGINHPGIITVFDVVEHDGAPVIVMEFVVGSSLAATVRDHGRLPAPRVAAIGLAVLEALTAAHAAGVVHRDLKPDNILLSGNRVVLTDFGIASIADATMSLTNTGTLLGTPAYMAPEQLDGKPASPASDLWSLGATLHTAVEGEAPFTAGTLTALYVAILTQPPRPSRFAGPLTPVLLGLLVKDPALRLTAEQTARLLAAAAQPAVAPAPPAPQTPPRQETARDAVPPPPVPSAPPPFPSAPPTTPPPAPDQARDATPHPYAHPAPGPVDTPHPYASPDPSPDPAPNPYASPLPSPNPYLSSAPFPNPYATPLPPVVPAPGPAAPGGPGRRRRALLFGALGVVAAVVPAGLLLPGLLNRYENAGGEVGGVGSSSPSPSSSRRSNDGGVTTTTTAAYDAAIDQVLNPSDRKGGTLNLGTSGDVDSLDPARSYYGWAWNFQRLYVRTLYAYAGAPGRDGTAVVPDLAAAAPEVSADGRTYTVRLRPGLKFEDGTPITAKDVKYGIERSFDQDVLFGGPVLLSDVLDQGQGYKGPYSDSDPDRLGLKSVRTPNDLTVVFSLAEPNGDFPYLLTLGTTAPVPKAADTRDKYGEKPVSSGPYRFRTVQTGKSYELERNPAWDQSTDPLRKALPDRIRLTVAGSGEEVDNRLLSGGFDLDLAQAGLQPATQAKVLADPGLKARTDDPATGVVRYVALVPAVPPLDNQHCRNAVLYAADPGALQTARGGPQSGTPVGTLLPPTVSGSDDYDPYGLTDGRPDPAKAKAELAACGKPNGFDTTMAVRADNPKEQAAALALQNSLKSVGINVTPQTYELKDMADTVGSPDTVKSKGYGLIMSSWIADYPSGGVFLQDLTDGRRIRGTGNYNFTGLNDPEINGWFDQATAQTDPARAAELYRKVNHKVADGAYYLPYLATRTLNYRNPRLTNVYVTDAYGGVDLQALGLSDGK
ncbi:protein kinase [Kitasatospora sp. NA04385]|uniref:ABC transporter substrate-binding protein n=1 Tax=Kitasatospora sp. NA04385 TaxID=2742135 RepID=UPI0015917A92|nr:ABC transporter substrate-binding protein [Kitasatospora sp. NA04385]QKW23269.1 protein kinase [Kitasatospora sp. NA04385]